MVDLMNEWMDRRQVQGTQHELDQINLNLKMR